MLHLLEVLLIYDTIKSLKETDNKSVLVDIFARNDNGSVRMQDIGIPETHTIVLFTQRSSGKIMVIDLSNSKYSKHLPANSARLFRIGEKYAEMIVPSTKCKIYAGLYPNQYRDCIDIAVKIAFGLNKLQEENIGFDEIMHSLAKEQ